MNDLEEENVPDVKTSRDLKRSRFDEIFETGQTVSKGRICILISPEFRVSVEKLCRFYEGEFNPRRMRSAVVGVFPQEGNIPTYKADVRSTITGFTRKMGVWLNPLASFPINLERIVRRQKLEPMAASLSGNFLAKEVASIHLNNVDEYVVYYLSRFMWKPVLRAFNYREGRATKAASERYALAELQRWRNL